MLLPYRSLEMCTLSVKTPCGNDLVQVTRVTVGPSAQEWETHKGEIVGMYRTRPLKDVQAAMKMKYNFIAR